MPGVRRPPHSPAGIQARAVQLENGTAALHLIRRAAGYEERAAELAAAGNVTAAGTLARAVTFRTVGGRAGGLDERAQS